MSIFEEKRISPMLIGVSGAPFNSEDHLFELKFDGIRCLAYLDPQEGTQLRNKRNIDVDPTYPELTELHTQAKGCCILDGELVVFEKGKPAFSEVQRRALMTDPLKIWLAAQKLPACFVAFDILYWQDREIMTEPLTKRKALLQEAVTEGGHLALSRVFEGNGTQLYALAEREALEGVVAKRRDSIYIPGKRTKNWIKIKNLLDDDFVILGYIQKEGGMNSLILGQYQDGTLIYKGHVTLGVSGESFRRIRSAPKAKVPPVAALKGNEHSVWIEPKLVCTVQFMERTASGGMRQPTFKGLREDKASEECVEH